MTDFDDSNALRRMATLRRIMHMAADEEEEAALAAKDAADLAKGTPPIRPRRIHNSHSNEDSDCENGRERALRCKKKRSVKRRPKRLLTHDKFTAAYKMMEPTASTREIDRAYAESKQWCPPNFDSGKQHRKLGRSAEAMDFCLDTTMIPKIDTGLATHKEVAHVVQHQTTNNEEGGRERRERARRAEFDIIMRQAGRHKTRAHIEADAKQARIDKERAAKKAAKEKLQRQRDAEKKARKQQQAAKATAKAKAKAARVGTLSTRLARSATFSI